MHVGSGFRKVDACAVEMSAGSRAVCEPTVVVLTTSEVDILDDGYRRWKYGQKVVKGNPIQGKSLHAMLDAL